MTEILNLILSLIVTDKMATVRPLGKHLQLFGVLNHDICGGGGEKQTWNLKVEHDELLRNHMLDVRKKEVILKIPSAFGV